MKTNNQIITNAIKDGRMYYFINLSEFYGKCSKVDKLRSGKMTTPDFIDLMEESDPYKLSELDDDRYLLQNKNTPISLLTYVTETKKREFYKHYKIIEKIYPELSNHLKRNNRLFFM